MISVPFSGSKRYRYKEVKEIAQNGPYSAVFEPFGGSCVLSVNLMRDRVIKRAVANDYDGLWEIYPEYLRIKERIVGRLEEAGIQKSQKPLGPKQCGLLQSLIKDVPKKYWQLLADNFVFSACRASGDYGLSSFRYFMNNTDMGKQWEYLNEIGRIELERLDYREFLEKRRPEFEGNPDALVILDPPYLNSIQKQYKNGLFFGVSETIELLEYMRDCGCDFIFFNQNSRDMKAILRVMGLNATHLVRVSNSSGHGSKEREDDLAYIVQNGRPKQISFAESVNSKGERE